MPHAIPVSESAFLQIVNAGTWLAPADRSAFYAQVVAEIAGRPIGEGAVSLAIAKAFKAFYRPIEVDPSTDAKPLRRLTRGSQKLDARYAAIEQRRQLRGIA